MKILMTAFCFCLLIFTHTVSAQTRIDREFDGLKGAVKTVRVEMYDISQRDGKDIEGPHHLLSVTSYDEKGNKTEASTYKYRDGSLNTRTVFTLEADGKKTGVSFKADGTIESKTVSTYDAHGRGISSLTYDAKGALQRKSVSIYDADGKFIEGAMYKPDGSLDNKTIFTYDAKGKWIGGELYDAKGNLMQKWGPTVEGRASTLYDQRDGTIIQKHIDKSPTREYDSQGNWVKESTPRTTTRAGQTEEVTAVTYRTITYY